MTKAERDACQLYVADICMDTAAVSEPNDREQKLIKIVNILCLVTMSLLDDPPANT
jgi:hypothetical protein